MGSVFRGMARRLRIPSERKGKRERPVSSAESWCGGWRDWLLHKAAGGDAVRIVCVCDYDYSSVSFFPVPGLGSFWAFLFPSVLRYEISRRSPLQNFHRQLKASSRFSVYFHHL